MTLTGDFLGINRAVSTGQSYSGSSIT